MSKTKSSFRWNKITPLSKTIALALFIALPFIGFSIGKWYQHTALEPLNSDSATSLTGNNNDQILTGEFYIGPAPYRLINRYFDSQTAQIILQDSAYHSKEYVLGDGHYGATITSVTRSDDGQHFVISYGAGDGQNFTLLGVSTSPDKTKITNTLPAKDLNFAPTSRDSSSRLYDVLAWIDNDHILVREKTYEGYFGDLKSTKYWNVSVSNPQIRKAVTLN